MTNDLISRDAVLALPRDIYRNLRGEIVDEMVNVKDIEALPSVQPERMRGRWETDGMMMDDGEYLMTRCTACGTAYEYGHDENYCGFCGADMRGEHNG